MLSADRHRYSHTIDANDSIVWVSAAWLAFARENGATRLTQELVLGRSLWHFIADDETTELYKALVGRVRAGRGPMVLPFRCDSPTLRRHMRLQVTLEEKGNVRFDSFLTRAEPCSYIGVLDSRFTRSADVLTMCSMCKRVLNEPSEWLDVEDAVARMNLLEAEKGPQLRYAVCPACLAAADNSVKP